MNRPRKVHFHHSIGLGRVQSIFVEVSAKCLKMVDSKQRQETVVLERP
jgi:ribosomal protein L28